MHFIIAENVVNCKKWNRFIFSFNDYSILNITHVEAVRIRLLISVLVLVLVCVCACAGTAHLCESAFSYFVDEKKNVLFILVWSNIKRKKTEWKGKQSGKERGRERRESTITLDIFSRVRLTDWLAAGWLCDVSFAICFLFLFSDLREQVWMWSVPKHVNYHCIRREPQKHLQC